ncbi:ABC transporter permease [Mongoliimonas terrestris]|uniref:ABC transporter permease n=1 Tax=Mongoliimonas terrestris TaxID=1709001 RepID=UPI000949AC27|nr:ABC transporter permease [Mongoliimonas terrestris]
MKIGSRLLLLLLQNAPYVLFVVLLVAFGLMSDRFLAVANFRNIIIQAAPIAILAIGMTFVLLIAHIDLSVGASMYLTASVLALYFTGVPWPVGLAAVAVGGAMIGLVNGLVVTRLGVASFIVTLAMLFILRGIAMWLSNTRMLMFPDAITDLNRTALLGIPSAILAFLVVFALAWVVLHQTPFGRQVYAVGEDPEAARKAGLPVERITLACFVIAGLCAGIGGFVTISQIGAVGPKYGDQVEFAAIAASVLGGVSLFGGRGSVAGTVFGAILIKTVQNGLNIINADPYIYPLVTAAIIFLAVAIDGLRTRILERLEQRTIRPLSEA